VRTGRLRSEEITVNSTTQLSAPAAAPAPHQIHGLVAIANGPDYCLCGNLWPCRPIEVTPAAAR
jgi:hypothetical protein